MFVLAALGTSLDILPQEGRDLVLAGAILSIFVNPFLFTLIVDRQKAELLETVEPTADVLPARHVVLVGYGRVGRLLGASFLARRQDVVVIEADGERATAAEASGLKTVRGNALDARTLNAAGITSADSLLIAVPEGFEGGAIGEKALALAPAIQVIVRAHSDDEVNYLTSLNIREIVVGERELAQRMLALALRDDDAALVPQRPAAGTPAPA